MKSDEIRYTDIETHADKIKSGGQSVMIVGLVLTIGNIVTVAFKSRLFDFTAVAAALCGIAMIFRSRHCRKLLAANIIISGLPALIMLIKNFIDTLSQLQINTEASLSGLAWLVSAAASFFENLFVRIAPSLLTAGVYAFMQVWSYIIIFETADVKAYIESKKFNK